MLVATLALRASGCAMRAAACSVIDMFYSGSSTNYSGNRLRPVVSLGSDVQITPSTGTNSASNKHTIDW